MRGESAGRQGTTGSAPVARVGARLREGSTAGQEGGRVALGATEHGAQIRVRPRLGAQPAVSSEGEAL